MRRLSVEKIGKGLENEKNWNVRWYELGIIHGILSINERDGKRKTRRLPFGKLRDVLF